jgi:hypothetical protein
MDRLFKLPSCMSSTSRTRKYSDEDAAVDARYSLQANGRRSVGTSNRRAGPTNAVHTFSSSVTSGGLGGDRLGEKALANKKRRESSSETAPSVERPICYIPLTTESVSLTEASSFERSGSSFISFEVNADSGRTTAATRGGLNLAPFGIGASTESDRSAAASVGESDPLLGGVNIESGRRD